MATTKKMDKKLVASKEDNESEVKYIAKTFKIPVGQVRFAIKTLKTAGKGFRSRKNIYAQLRTMGYTIDVKSKESKAVKSKD